MRPERRGLAAVAIGAFVLGIVLMVPFDHPLTLAAGVLSLFVYITAGLFLIATPEELDRDRGP